MAYETRRGRKYYYRAWRLDGRVVKQYLGNGLAAEHVAAEVAERKLARQDEQRREQRVEYLLSLLAAGTAEYWEASERVLRLALRVSGYHEHRGQWRRRRESVTPR